MVLPAVCLQKMAELQPLMLLLLVAVAGLPLVDHLLGHMP
jgi:hypothetical protein